MGSNQNIKFNTDAADAILDTGYSTTISCSKKDFITYKKASGQVEDLGTHNVVGTG